MGSMVCGHYVTYTYRFNSEVDMISDDDIKMAIDFFDSVHVPTNKPMDTLKVYTDLCAAQARAIENYAKVVNQLKDELDTLRGAK